MNNIFLSPYSTESLYKELDSRIKTDQLKYMNIILLGPPGCGKGTQAEKLKELLNICKFSSGDIFRKHVNDKTVYGIEAEEVMRKGELLSDELSYKMLDIKGSLLSEQCTKGIVFDGFPRTLLHCEYLSEVTKSTSKEITSVIKFEYDKESIVRRVNGRLIHKNSGRVYHELYNKPKIDYKDDVTGEELIKRDDDKKIERRIDVYENEIHQQLEFFSKNGYSVIGIDSNMSIDVVKYNILYKLNLLL